MIALAWELVSSKAERAVELAGDARRSAAELEYPRGVAAALNLLAHANIAFLSNYEIAREQLEQCLEIFRELGDRNSQIGALNLFGTLHRRRGDGHAAIFYHTQSLELARELGCRTAESTALNGMGYDLALMGDTERALESHRAGLEIARETGKMMGVAAALNGLGNVHEKRGQLTEALECYMNCLEIAQKIDNHQLRAYTSGNIAIIYQRFGNNTEALRYELESMEGKQRLGDRWGEGVSYNNVGLIYKNLSDYANALEAYLNSLSITEEIGDLQGQSVALNNVGRIYAALGDPSGSLEYYQRSLAISEQIGFKQGQAFSFAYIGDYHREQGDYPRALIHYVKSLKLHRGTNDRYGERRVLKSIGDIHLYVDELDKAQEHYHNSLAIAVEMGDRQGQAVVLMCLADVEQRSGGYQAAAGQLQEALKIVGDIGNRNLTGEALLKLSVLHEAMGEHQCSETFRRMHDDVRRELFNDEMKERVSRLIEGFEKRSAQREAELLGLRQEDLADVGDALVKVSHRRTEQILERAGLRNGASVQPQELSFPAIQVHTFGEFRVMVHGRELSKADWRRKRARDLFKLLLLNHGMAVTIDDMVEHLWGGLAERNVELLVMNAVSHIRRALEPDREPHRPSAILTSSDRAYTLDMGPEAVIDFIRFRHLIADARRSPLPALKRRLYAEAVGLYTGEFLKEDLYERWTEHERERLHAMLFEGLTWLGAEYLREERFEEAIAVARRLLDYDGTSERGHETLIAGLARSGQRVEAHKAFNKCVAMFRSELGVEPPERISAIIAGISARNGHGR